MADDWNNCVNNVEEAAKVASKIGTVAGGAVGLYASVKLSPAIMLSRAVALSSAIPIGAMYGLSDAPAASLRIDADALNKLMNPTPAEGVNAVLGATAAGVAAFKVPKIANFGALVIAGAQYGGLGADLAVKKLGMSYCDSRYEKPLFQAGESFDCINPPTPQAKLACERVNSIDWGALPPPEYPASSASAASSPARK